MAEFAALAGKAPEVLKQVEEQAVELRDTLAKNWKQNNLTTEFPTKAVFPTVDELGEEDAAFKWVQAETVKYQSAYYSHIRATTASQKAHVDKAAEKTAKRDATSKAESAAIEKQVAELTMAKLAEKYTQQHKAAVALAFEKATPKKPPKKIIEGYHKHKARKFHVKLSELTTHEEYGQLVAAAIVKNKKSKKFKDKFSQAHSTALRERAKMTLVEGGADESKVEAKLQKAMQEHISDSVQRSVVLCYEVSYQVMKINKQHAQKRWSEALRERAEEIDDDLATNREEIRKVREDLSKIRDEKDAATQKLLLEDAQENLKELLAKKQELQAAKKNDLDAIRSRKGEFDKYVDERRRIGGFAITPIKATGALESSIHYRNTNAKMTAEVAHQPDRSVRVRFSWHEDGTVGVPKAGEMFDQDYNDFGSVTFRHDGAFEVDGKIGERFKENAERVS